MGRKRKNEESIAPVATEKKRKAVKAKRIDREHAGKVARSYQILEKLLASEDAFSQIRDAEFVCVWQKGWRPDVDGVLLRASIKKASDMGRELGEEFDFAIVLNYELWNDTKISDELAEIDIFHQLCHAAPEMDRDGEQRRDDRGRPCWRLRKDAIREFPEVIAKYGLKKVTGLNALAIAWLDDAKKRTEAAAETNDKDRPLLKAAEKAEKGGGKTSDVKADAKATDSGAWRNWTIGVLGQHGLPPGKVKLLESAFDDRLGKLIDSMNRCEEPGFWYRNIKGLGEGGYDATVNAIMQLRKSRPEFQADAT